MAFAPKKKSLFFWTKKQSVYKAKTIRKITFITIQIIEHDGIELRALKFFQTRLELGI